ncbi:NAD(P)H-binding protein [Paraflavitalea sp. CAU 1676]|uniref:NAD(P)H-binding protein n=1 Tax=Paraflavitalea sp. CAU 1676 TaxID=3032598 RepID=UPI0023DBF61E|nr:NAD(P)H-binding protein [Paraflavitalea sp. CAU 1676]MDF2188415.1 NAD(P)H-binding protein [Paraflavitalea sp. CAU 1676]
MKALIIGATGATGKDLVKVLLEDKDYTAVVLFVRRASGLKHPKLSEIITNFDQLEAVSDHIKGDVWFSCLGTTLKTAGTKEKQWQIDYEIPARFAAIAKQNGVRSTVLLSAYGAAASSKVFYSRMKGQLEDLMTGLAFDQLIIFKPGLLLRKDSDRVAERMMAGMLKFLNAVGIIRKFKPMPTDVLAGKMAKAPKVLGDGKHVIELEKIFSM